MCKLILYKEKDFIRPQLEVIVKLLFTIKGQFRYRSLIKLDKISLRMKSIYSKLNHVLKMKTMEKIVTRSAMKSSKDMKYTIFSPLFATSVLTY